MRAILLGLLASCFFSSAFIFNRAMEVGGGSWLWSASLRFILMAPILFFIIAIRGQLAASMQHLSQHFWAYLIWSTVGFGLFYAPLTFASVYSPGWLVAGSWQITIIAGSLLLPFLSKTSAQKRIPWKELKWSCVIIIGVFLMLWEQITQVSVFTVLAGFLPVVLAAFMYPLGNRKMMQICDDEIKTPERVFNMTLASLPFWLLISLYGGIAHGVPSMAQLSYSFIVALFSGVIATLLFFSATNSVKNQPNQLAIVEATQSGEVLFTLFGEMLLLGSQLPSTTALLGVFCIILGMAIHSMISMQATNNLAKKQIALDKNT